MRPLTWLVGFALIGLGLFFLLRNFAIVPSLPVWLLAWWPALLAGIGLILVVRALRQSDRDGLVPGVILIIYGAFLLLVPLRVIRAADIGRYWGVFPGAIGVALLTRAAVTRRNHSALMPGIVLVVVGALGLFENFWKDAWRFWPVILIVLGVLIISRRRA